MSKPLLSIIATIHRPGTSPVRLEVKSEPVTNATPMRLQAEIDDCFGKLRAAVQEELQ